MSEHDIERYNEVTFSLELDGDELYNTTEQDEGTAVNDLVARSKHFKAIQGDNNMQVKDVSTGKVLVTIEPSGNIKIG